MFETDDFISLLCLLGLVLRRSSDIHCGPQALHVRAGWEGRVPPRTETEASYPGSGTSGDKTVDSAAFHTINIKHPQCKL